MKLTLIALLAAFFAAGCTKTIYTHRADFSPVKRRGAWNDYYTAVKEGRKYEPPKEQEKK